MNIQTPKRRKIKHNTWEIKQAKEENEKRKKNEDVRGDMKIGLKVC